MSSGNYVVTATKPTSVTHSCVGNFTAPHERNLVIAKSSRLEIHLLTPDGLQPLFDVPINGRIATLELFRPHGEEQDLLFISTERYTFCVLQWNIVAGNVNTRTSGDFWCGHGVPTDNGQICFIDPDCNVVCLRLDEDILKVFKLDNNIDVDKSNIVRLGELHVLDIKFLYGYTKPTIAFIFQDNKGVRHISSYEIDKDLILVEGPLSRRDLITGAYLLIPVPSPLFGILIFGKRSIVYYSASGTMNEISIRPFITRAYARVDAYGSRYLLGDENGILHQLVITHENSKVTGIKTDRLGETSIASSISYLDSYVYIGSSYGDSQLIKLNPEPDANGSYVEVVQRYENLGPISDFCVVDLERMGQSQVVICSGAYKDGSLRILSSGYSIREKGCLELEGILGMWSLKNGNFGLYDTFLVLSFRNETKIMEMNSEDELVEIEITGFCSKTKTLFCHDAMCSQLVQVTSESVRLVSSASRELQNEWFIPGMPINVAAANSTQVLLATSDNHLVYLQIEDGVLMEVKRAKLECSISCIDISPIGDNPNSSLLAAVGTWDVCVRIYTLPSLKLVQKVHVEAKIEKIARSLLLCSFEGVSYLFCGLGNGHLLRFVLSMKTGELTDRKELSLGKESITLCNFSSENVPYIFAASDQPTVIYSNKKELLYSNVMNLEKARCMCPFYSAAFPDSLAIANGDRLFIGTLNIPVRTIPLGEHARRICHQEQTSTYALYSIKYNQSISEEDPEEHAIHAIHLLNDQNFNFISTYTLGQDEYACSIVNCSFSDDESEYYCAGTSFLDEDKEEPRKGRILVFTIEDKQLHLFSERETDGCVYSLNAFNGKLLAAINQKIQLYNWVLWDDGSYELQPGPVYNFEIIAQHVQTRGDSIVVGNWMSSIFVLTYKHEEDEFEVQACNHQEKWISAIEVLGDGIYLFADDNYNLCTFWENPTAAKKERSLEVDGLYHIGDFVSGFRYGSLVTNSLDSNVGRIRTVIFGTANGMIGVIASLPNEKFQILHQLQSNVRKVRKGVGAMSHTAWRSFYTEEKVRGARQFLDGDLMEAFLDLSSEEKEAVSKLMYVPVDELTMRVEELPKLRFQYGNRWES